ncbi:hypothetical protein [uncultured Roseovarius sp.]|uniref:hypothetical protein n=1 Tax=uncultured Roseovarius sp. TaxID=293344 RepID=UPI00262F2DF5|nr:hypothetical protein [uncultured Roseovarius sp.]
MIVPLKFLFAATAIVTAASPVILSAQTAQQGFETMVQPAEDEDECKAPKPPKDLAETAYLRNGYRAILRIMAIEEWQETGSCECTVSEISWVEVVAKANDFVISENPRRPFDVVALDRQASEMEAERAIACSTK